jgi:hypothetical protein
MCASSHPAWFSYDILRRNRAVHGALTGVELEVLRKQIILFGTASVRISSTKTIEGSRVLYTIGEIEAGSVWHPENASPLRKDWREEILRELVRRAEDIDADAIIGVGYRNDAPIRSTEGGVNLKRVVASGMAVKLSCAA